MTFDHMIVEDHVTNWNHSICTNTIPMAIKLGKGGEIPWGTPLITLHDPPVTWFGEVMWKNKHFTFPLALDHWLPSMEKWGLKSVSSNKFTQTFKLVVMLQIENIISHYHNVYGHQIFHGGNICWRPMDAILGKVLIYRERPPPLTNVRSGDNFQ